MTFKMVVSPPHLHSLKLMNGVLLNPYELQRDKSVALLAEKQAGFKVEAASE